MTDNQRNTLHTLTLAHSMLEALEKASTGADATAVRAVKMRNEATIESFVNHFVSHFVEAEGREQ